MSASPTTRLKNEWLIQHPERVSDALANVILQEGPRETILGQAWLAAPGRMITCGHVVERFAGNPMGLYVKFPSSGNVYPVQMVRLHPSFVRQPDQLVKFDVALLEVNFGPPESAATPLPFSYEQPLQTNQTLWVIRYPTHLAQLSAATQPLTQDGKFLGPLRKHDSFHLLHDLPLAPGDSGAPITDGHRILALHCGDTATLPGLNLPTTSIRLALWVDSLRELGLNETIKPGSGGASINFLVVVASFLLSLAVGGFLSIQFLTSDLKKQWTPANPRVCPVKVSFNEPVRGYKMKEKVEITLVPQGHSFLYLFQVTGDDKVFRLYPQNDQDSKVRLGEQRIISKMGSTELTANAAKDKLLLVVIEGGEGESISKKVILPDDIHKVVPVPGEFPQTYEFRKLTEPYTSPLNIKGEELIARVNSLKKKNPSLVILAEFDAPRSPE